MIEKINTILAQIPPNWMSRVTERGGNIGSPEAELRKLLGEPLPKTVDPSELPPEIAELFATFGMLQKIRKKLAWISKKRGNKIIPAENTVACVDEDDNIYIGIEFLKKYKENEDLIAGIMAHEWGHMISELAPGTDLSHLSWDELLAVRREEEAAADAFAGRALFQMGYDIKKMIDFLEKADQNRKARTHKYHSSKVRAKILQEAHNAQVRAVDQIRKLFGFEGSGLKDPSKSRLIAVA